MSRVVGFGLGWCFLFSCAIVRAAEEAEALAAERATTQLGRESAWHDPSNHIRPHKGQHTDANGRQVANLVWVLYSGQGQPLAIGEPGSKQVEIYFSVRLDSKLTQIAAQHALTAPQCEKLRLAAQLDLARLFRLAQHVDGALAGATIGADDRAVNKLFHSLAVACDQQLFASDSLFNRVLATQLDLP